MRVAALLFIACGAALSGACNAAPVVLHCVDGAKADSPGTKYTIDVEARTILIHLPNGDSWPMEMQESEDRILGLIGPRENGAFFSLDRHTLQYTRGQGRAEGSFLYFRESGTCRKIEKAL